MSRRWSKLPTQQNNMNTQARSSRYYFWVFIIWQKKALNLQRLNRDILKYTSLHKAQIYCGLIKNNNLECTTVNRAVYSCIVWLKIWIVWQCGKHISWISVLLDTVQKPLHIIGVEPRKNFILKNKFGQNSFPQCSVSGVVLVSNIKVNLNNNKNVSASIIIIFCVDLLMKIFWRINWKFVVRWQNLCPVSMAFNINKTTTTKNSRQYQISIWSDVRYLKKFYFYARQQNLKSLFITLGRVSLHFLNGKWSVTRTNSMVNR